MLKRMFRGAVRVAALLAFTMPLAYAQSAPAAKRPHPRPKRPRPPRSRRTSTPAAASAATRRSRSSTTPASTRGWRARAATPASSSTSAIRPRGRRRSWIRPTAARCHQNQFRTMYNMNWEKTARKEKVQATGPSPNPAFDKLMMPHGFTKEHNEPRSHAFALYDQLVVDRAFGGRFQNKEGWQFLGKDGGNVKIWDYLEDQYPGQDHKAFKPGTAAAANPVCMSCKTSDHILDWAYLGDPVPGAKWSRTSKVVDFVKDVNHSLNCNFCHDPHSAKPRVIRDGLIQALTRPEKDTLWHKDPRGRQDRGQGPRRARLHAQDRARCRATTPTCSAASATSSTTATPAPTRRRASRSAWPTSAPTTSRSSRSPRSASTTPTSSSATSSTGSPARCCGRRSTRTSRRSTTRKHQKAGVECSQCHMPKVKDPKTGKTFTSHWQTSPKHYVKETCLTCHKRVDREAGRLRDRLAEEPLRRQGPQGRVLADAIRRQVRGSAEPRRRSEGPRGGARQALRRARQLGMVDGLQRLALPQPGPGHRVAEQVDDGLAGRHQAARRRDGREAQGHDDHRSGGPGAGRHRPAASK